MTKIFHVNSNVYEHYEEDFGVISGSGNVYWYPCRDEFQEIANIGRFLYHCKNGTIRNTKNFVKKIESIIKLPKNKKLKFRKTDSKNVLYVSLGDFWKTKVHRSLLTILLRAGSTYKDKNWEQVIKNDCYLAATPEAIKRFLSGYTRPTLNYTQSELYGEFSGFSGWVNEFQHGDKGTIEKKLR